MTVQRWDVNFYDGMADVMIEESVDGEYVEYEDYAELERQITAYQIAKDNLELRASKGEHYDALEYGTGGEVPIVFPAQVY